MQKEVLPKSGTAASVLTIPLTGTSKSHRLTTSSQTSLYYVRSSGNFRLRLQLRLVRRLWASTDADAFHRTMIARQKLDLRRWFMSSYMSIAQFATGMRVRSIDPGSCRPERYELCTECAELCCLCRSCPGGLRGLSSSTKDER